MENKPIKIKFTPVPINDCIFFESIRTDPNDFMKETGIVLKNNVSRLFLKIQNTTSQENAYNNTLFSLHTQNFEKNDLSMDGMIDALKTLTKNRLVFEFFYFELNENNRLELYTVFTASSGKYPALQLHAIYNILLEKSISALHQFVVNTKQIDEDNVDKILSDSLEDPNPLNETEITKLLSSKYFKVPPNQEMIDRSMESFSENIQLNSQLFEIFGFGYYFIPKEFYSIFLNHCLRKLESVIIPSLFSTEPEIKDKIQKIFNDELEEFNDGEKIKNNSYKKKVCELIKKFYTEHDKKVKGKGIIELIIGLSDVVDQIIHDKMVREAEKEVDIFINMMGKNFDFNSRLLRINVEDNIYGNTIITQLKIHPNIINAEWYENDSKTLIFVEKDVENIKDLNSIIYEKYRINTHYILYLREILEKNEDSVLEIFKDKDFIKKYGINLKEVYKKYFPWYYNIFFMLGIKSMIDSGFQIAKSALKFDQMDRQFKYQEKILSQKRKKAKEEADKQAEKNLEEKYNEFLKALKQISSVDKKLPTIYRIQSIAPILVDNAIEELIQKKKIVKLHPNDETDKKEDVLLYPFTKKNKDKINEILSLANSIKEKMDNYSNDEVSKAEVIIQFLSNQNQEALV